MNENLINKMEMMKLSEKELDALQPMRMLLPSNPQAAKNQCYYSYKDRKLAKDDAVSQLQVHFDIEGYYSNLRDLILKGGNEEQIQIEINEIRNNMINQARRQQESEDPGIIIEDIAMIKKTLRNKFNYNDRQCQTMNNPIRHKGVSTQAPVSIQFSFEVNQWEIFDAYMKDLQQQNANSKKGNQQIDIQSSGLYSSSFKKQLKIMERMCVQNDQKEQYYDYKVIFQKKYYWSNGETFDAMKNEGHQLPIWRFSIEKQRKKNVTSICWNPKYHDLFAVGLGSYDFLRQRMGLICLYSIKNTTHPEYQFTTESGVMSLDFHPSSPALLAVGLYDGTVLVYDIRNKHKRPIYQSNVRTSKHTDPVWQVYWNPDIAKKFNFYSISSDGRVMNWNLMKNKLEPEEVIRLKLIGRNHEDESSLIGLASGLCFDFNKFDPNTFILGTEEGRIHKCSKSYSGQYQETYQGHLLAVYKVRWNNFHPRTFISASADWTVKIWDSKIVTPILSFDLAMAVVDAVWAPYSSTVFATTTLDKVYIYDLNIDKHSKLSEQRPVRQPKLTNLQFNKRDPILLVGDCHGGVTLVKLSPNLTIGGKVPAGFEGTVEQFEEEKMEKLLNIVGKFENG